MSKKRKDPYARQTVLDRHIRDRLRVLAPTALAALLGGGADADAAEPSEPAPAELREAADAEPGVRLGMGGVLPAALQWMTGLERTELIATWASSRSPLARLSIARALGTAPPAIGTHSAIELLSRDVQPDVRLAAAEAAWLRRAEAPARMSAVLERLLDDPDPAVRARAELALGRDVG